MAPGFSKPADKFGEDVISPQTALDKLELARGKGAWAAHKKRFPHEDAVKLDHFLSAVGEATNVQDVKPDMPIFPTSKALTRRLELVKEMDEEALRKRYGLQAPNHTAIRDWQVGKLTHMFYTLLDDGHDDLKEEDLVQVLNILTYGATIWGQLARHSSWPLRKPKTRDQLLYKPGTKRVTLESLAKLQKSWNSDRPDLEEWVWKKTKEEIEDGWLEAGENGEGWTLEEAREIIKDEDKCFIYPRFGIGPDKDEQGKVIPETGPKKNRNIDDGRSISPFVKNDVQLILPTGRNLVDSYHKTMCGYSVGSLEELTTVSGRKVKNIKGKSMVKPIRLRRKKRMITRKTSLYGIDIKEAYKNLGICERDSELNYIAVWNPERSMYIVTRSKTPLFGTPQSVYTFNICMELFRDICVKWLDIPEESVSSYFDDIFGAAPDDIIEPLVRTLEALLNLLGLPVEKSKTEMGKEIKSLGINYAVEEDDSLIAFLTEERIKKLIADLEKLQKYPEGHKNGITDKKLKKVCGKLGFILQAYGNAVNTKVNPIVLPLYWAAYAYHKAQRQKWRDEAKYNTDAIIRYLRTIKPRRFSLENFFKPPVVMFTDASFSPSVSDPMIPAEASMGAVIFPDTSTEQVHITSHCYTNKLPADVKSAIAYLEALTVLTEVRRLRSMGIKQRVLYLYTDNAVVFYGLTRGRSRSTAVNRVITEILLLAVTLGISLIVRFVPTAYNIADLCTRRDLLHNWNLLCQFLPRAIKHYYLKGAPGVYEPDAPVKDLLLRDAVPPLEDPNQFYRNFAKDDANSVDYRSKWANRYSLAFIS